MRCPHCQEEITTVVVNSNAFQTGYLKEYAPGVWGIENYGDDIIIEDTINMQCPSCLEEVSMLRDDLMIASDAELVRLSLEAQESDRVNWRIRNALWDNPEQSVDPPLTDSEPF